jgi:glyoxylase I family protein
MLKLNHIHHIAIICSDYGLSRKFYTEILGLRIKSEHYRKERESFKLDLKLGDNYIIELFSFPETPKRPTTPEACGLRHLAFEVDDIEASTAALNAAGVNTESVRIDEYTGKRFTFFSDPDGLPLELYER